MHGPKFPVGFPLNVGYMGLYRADVEAETRSGQPIRPPYAVHGLRLVPEFVEIDADGDGPAGYRVEYPKGWEYFAARVTPYGEWKEYGWFTEAELLKAEYVPPVTNVYPQSVAPAPIPNAFAGVA